RAAEEMVRELYKGLTDDQKKSAVHAFDEGGQVPRRMSLNPNRALAKRIGDVYSKPQQELIAKILQSLSSGEAGYKQFTRNGTFDGSGSLQGCGCDIFGDPTEGKNWAWLFTGHHFTLRCDGNL